MKSFNPLHHSLCFAPVHRLAPSTWTGHIPFAMFLTGILAPRVIIELGVFYGTSYCAFCQAVRELKSDARCYGIDSWQGDPQSGFYGAEIFDDLKKYHDELYGDFSRLIQSTFDEAVGHFSDQTIDLLHIDGFHTYESVKKDFETWLPKMSGRGVILFHDINVREADFGVWKFWEETRLAYPSFEFAHSHGLGVLAVGGECPAEFLEFLEFAAENPVQIADFFSRQGRRLENLQELQLARQTLAQRDETIARLQNTEQTLAEQKAQIEKRLREREIQIAALEQKSDTAEARNLGIAAQLREEIENEKRRFFELEKEFQKNEEQQIADARLSRELEAEAERLDEANRAAEKKAAELHEKEQFLTRLGQELIIKSQRLNGNDRETRAALAKSNGAAAPEGKLKFNSNGNGKPKDAALRLVLGVVTYNNSPEQIAQLLRSIELAAEELKGLPIETEIFVLDNGRGSLWRESVVPIIRFSSGGNVGFGNAVNRLMTAAFADAATKWFLCLNPDGTLHRRALKELLAMSGEYPDSLIEARQFPEEHNKNYDGETLETPWASGACLLICRDIFECIGGFDPKFFMYLEDVDFSWRARSAGFSVKIAPQAIFGHSVLNRGFDAFADKNMLLSGRYLAAKWNDPKFVKWAENELVNRKYYASLSELPALPQVFEDIENLNPQLADFANYFSFSKTRW